MTYNPYAALETLDVGLLVAPLPRGTAFWMPAQRVVLVNVKCTRAQRRCGVAHEVEHVLTNDTACALPVYGVKQERRCHLRASRKLIRIEDLAEALLDSEYEHTRAEALWVDLLTLRVRLEHLTKRERDYLDERGVGVQEWGAA